MSTAAMKLVTIVGERVLAERLCDLLREHGASGWTLAEAVGEGSRGMRASPLPGDNVRVDAVVTETCANRVLAALADELFPHYALVAWVADVQVVRGEKYR